MSGVELCTATTFERVEHVSLDANCCTFAECGYASRR
jgi:hypothetical protein